jgi:hypothetical protein
LSAITTATASADLSAGLQLAVVANYSAESDARQVHGALRGLLGLGRLSTPKERTDVHRFFDAFQIHLSAATLKVNADVPAQTMESLVAQFDLGRTPTR